MSTGDLIDVTQSVVIGLIGAIWLLQHREYKRIIKGYEKREDRWFRLVGRFAGTPGEKEEP